MKRAVVALALIVSLAACSGGGGTVAAAPSPTVKSPTTAPTTTTQGPMTKQEAAATYLRLVKPYNTRLDKFDRALRSKSATRKKVRAATKPWCDSMRKFMGGLLAEDWPAKVQRDVNGLARETAKQLTWCRIMQHAKTLNDVIAIYNTQPRDQGNAQLIRSKLGLPEPPQ